MRIARAMIITTLLAAAAHAAEPTVVTVTGEGIDRDDALKAALRAALEKGAGTQIASFSHVENFELMRDTIYSRASGIVTDYDILEESKSRGVVKITVRAKVNSDVVTATWGEVQNTLDQIGRPKIMVLIDERIDGVLQPDSVTASRIEKMFTDIGFDLVAREAVAEITQREGADATITGDEAKLQRLAKDAGAHLYIRGYANADRAGMEDLYGVPAAFYNCDMRARAYWTDTAKLLASEAMPTVRRGVRTRKEFSPQAAREALMEAAFPQAGRPARREAPLAERLFRSVMEQWATQITAGGETVLEVDNLSFGGFRALRDELREFDRLDSVEADFSKGTGVFRLRGKIATETLADLLDSPPFDQYLEINDLGLNRIQANGVDD